MANFQNKELEKTLIGKEGGLGVLLLHKNRAHIHWYKSRNQGWEYSSAIVHVLHMCVDLIPSTKKGRKEGRREGGREEGRKPACSFTVF
jgi:hypothetical protein